MERMHPVVITKNAFDNRGSICFLYAYFGIVCLSVSLYKEQIFPICFHIGFAMKNLSKAAYETSMEFFRAKTKKFWYDNAYPFLESFI